MTADQLAAIYDCPLTRAALWLPHMDEAMHEFGITTPQRQAAFIAQVGHESGRLAFVREIWNPAQCPWQDRYEVRADLGNNQVGDGHKFLGRGLLQVTGRDAYRQCGVALGLPLEEHPEQLEMAKYAALSAGWVWRDFKHLNEIADVGDFTKITKRINGGTNGYADRVMLWERAKGVLLT